MKINYIESAGDDKYFLAMLKGYCYANNISLSEVILDVCAIDKIEKIKPNLIVVPLDELLNESNFSVADKIRRFCAESEIKVFALSDVDDIKLIDCPDWVHEIIKNRREIGEIDCYLREYFPLGAKKREERRGRERRSFVERRSANFTQSIVNAVESKMRLDCQYGSYQLAEDDFQIDRRNKCVFLNGNKIDLTRKEFELFELLSTDLDRVFAAEEIIRHLWPENSRATKSDLYQYMHLLRKKIENDPNNPHWIMTVKGFGYKLNVGREKEGCREAICI